MAAIYLTFLFVRDNVSKEKTLPNVGGLTKKVHSNRGELTMQIEGAWNVPLKKKFNWEGFAIEMIAVGCVLLVLGLIVRAKLSAHKEQVQKMYSISLPPGAKDSISGHPGDYITVTSNPQTGPYCLTRGIWLIEVADRSGEGLYVLQGRPTDDTGVTTKVTLTMTTNHFVENNSGIAFTLISKSSSSFDKVAAAFSGNDFVAKDPK